MKDFDGLRPYKTDTICSYLSYEIYQVINNNLRKMIDNYYKTSKRSVLVGERNDDLSLVSDHSLRLEAG